MNMENEYDSQTPFFIAIQYGHMNIMDRLIQENIDINKPNSIGEYAIHVAAKHNQLQAFNRLIEHKAKLYVKCRDGHTPLYYGILKKSIDIVRRLLELQTMFDFVSFSIAIRYKRLAILDLFIHQIHSKFIGKNGFQKGLFEVLRRRLKYMYITDRNLDVLLRLV
eukprot:CAMPEP_0117418190 /NCGR_PEP_ID=MMETSP0758-20121206/28_1 /TAXON_ID=63605 /ORGANISM="Percolomonas cosmopolitus, Strain AE-1 (ATCC 50343)" /LENGTH=164 /DNA_ID=CAMNT_0005198559 /DNA_START=685 /DNA_END=1176 /DNA_ORIENTATION=+